MSVPKRYAIITGSASGLGRALAIRLAQAGWHLALADVDDAGNAETLAEVLRSGGTAETEHLDVSDAAAWQQLASRLEAAWPQLDLLVNNAGVAGAGEMGEFPLEDWRWMIGTNLFGAVFGCHTLVRWMKRNPQGAHIINTSSLAAIASAPTMAAYNMSKAAIIALSETLAAELARDRIGVTVLCPSFFQSGLLETARMHTVEEHDLAARSMERAPFTADDVARAALRAMRRKQLYVVMPLKGRVWWRLKRAVPEWFAWFLGREYAKGLPESL